MEWSGHQTFVEAAMTPFTVDGTEAGSLKTYGPLSFLKVRTPDIFVFPLVHGLITLSVLFADERLIKLQRQFTNG